MAGKTIKISPSAKLEASDIETAPTRLDTLAHISGLTMLVAANPATSGETLAYLATVGKSEVQKAVAKNPNARFVTLLSLLPKHTEEVLDNPALPFLLMENPALPAKLSADELLFLLRYDRLPRAFLAHARSLADNTVRQQAMHHVGVAGEVGPHWYPTFIRKIGDIIVPHASDLPCFQVPDLLPIAFLAALAEKKDWYPFLAHCPDITPEICDVLMYHGDEFTWAKLVKNPNATPQALANILFVGSLETRAVAAAHPRMLPEMLRALATDDAPKVQLAVAGNPATPSDALQRLAHNPMGAVQEAVAAHAQTPEEQLAILAQSTFATVRQQVAANPNTPAMTLALLARDPVVQVRAAVIKHPHVPPDVFAQLARENAPEMLEALAASPSLTMDSAWKLFAAHIGKLHELMAANPHLPTDVHAKIMQHFSEPAFVRGLARNPTAPTDLLAWLAGHKNYVIRRMIAANSHLPPVAQARLVESSDFETLLALAHNPTTELSILAHLSEYAELALFAALAWHPAMNSATRHSIYVNYVAAWLGTKNGTPANTRLFGLLADALPTPTRAKPNSLDWLDRFEFAHSVHSPKKILEQLRLDGNRFVRAAARQSLANYQMANTKETL